MSRKRRTEEAWDRTREAAAQLKPVAAQVKPLAKSTGEAAKRGVRRTRVWAAPQVERTGQVLQETVAPKVSAALSSAAQRIDPSKPRSRRWRMPVGIATTITAAASAAVAYFRNRSKPGSATSADRVDDTPPAATTTANGQAQTSTDAEVNG